MSLADLGNERLPRLHALAGESAVALMNVTVAGFRTDLASACLTLGAGRRMAFPTAGRVDPRAIHLQAGELSRLHGGASSQRSIGQLGATLRRAGRRVGTVLGSHPCGGGELFLTAMDERGTVSIPSDEARLLRRDSKRPFGLALDLDRAMEAASQRLKICDLVAVDPGDLERARRYASLCTPERAAAHLAAALRSLDDLVGRLQALVRERGGIFILVSPVAGTRSGDPFGLLLIRMPKGSYGRLTSGATRVPGLVANTDFLPTIAKLLEAPVDRSTVGTAVALEAASGKSTEDRVATELNRLSRASARAEAWRGPALTALRIGLLLVALGGAFGARSEPRRRRFLWWPWLLLLAILLAGDIVAPPTAPQGAFHATVGVAALATAAWSWRGASTPATVLILGGMTVLLIVGDLLGGGHLARWSPLGYSLSLGARYYGVGNEIAGLLLGGALLTPFAAVEVWPERRRLVALVGAGLYAATVVCLGGPSLGADFGGALAAGLAFALAMPLLLGERLRTRHAVGAVSLLFLVALILIAWDASRPHEAQSHLGRLVGAASGGTQPLVDAIRGKAITALRVMAGFWGLLALLEAAAGLALLQPLPSRPLRSGLALMVPAAAALLLFNDSGVIAAALALAPLPAAAAALQADTVSARILDRADDPDGSPRS